MFGKIKAFLKRKRKKKKEEKTQEIIETPAETVVMSFDVPQTPPEDKDEDDVPSGRYTPEYMEFLEKLEEVQNTSDTVIQTEENNGIDASTIRK